MVQLGLCIYAILGLQLREPELPAYSGRHDGMDILLRAGTTRLLH
jgi:hypothetical protein